MIHPRIHIKCIMSSTMQKLRKNKWDIVRDQRKTFMSTETIASMSLRVSIISYIVGAKEVFIFFNYEVPLRKFLKKYRLSHWNWAWYRKKMVGVQEVIHIKKFIQKLKKNVLPLFINGMGSWIFFRTSLVLSITYILVIKIGWAVFEKIIFFDFSKFVHNFCKKNFFELILGMNLSCNGGHLSSQYGSNPSGGTQIMLIVLQPLLKLLYCILYLGFCISKLKISYYS